MTCPYCQQPMTELRAEYGPPDLTLYLCERAVLYMESRTNRRCGVTLAKAEVRQP